jgi:hypothetical protein
MFDESLTAVTEALTSTHRGRQAPATGVAPLREEAGGLTVDASPHHVEIR